MPTNSLKINVSVVATPPWCRLIIHPRIEICKSVKLNGKT